MTCCSCDSHKRVIRLAHVSMSSPSDRPHVFISYSSRDAAVAQALEVRLSAATQVWRDKSRIEADWSREIASALARSEFVIMFWSAAAASSRWVRHEWMTARALGLRLLVVNLADAPALPEPIINLEITTSGDLDVTTEWLMARIGHGGGHSYDYSILPGRSQIPFLPNPAFVGRESELVELYLATIGELNSLGRSIVGLTGLAGVGKTQLAVEFAYRFAYAFEAVLWMQGADPLEWRAQCARIGRHYFGADIAADDRDQTAAILRLHETLSHRIGRVLLVIDNVPDPALLNRDSTLGPDVPFTLLTLGASVLFTSRRTLRLPGVTMHPLERLSDTSALTLLTRERTIGGDQGDAAREICRAVGNLPLGLVLINGFLRKYPDVTFRDYVSELRSRLVSTLDSSDVSAEELATRHIAAISATLAGHLEVLDDPARRLLALIAQLPESAIVPRARLRLAFYGRGTGSVVKRPFDRAANFLVDISLAERLEDADGLRLHPIVRVFVLQAFPDHATLRNRAAEQILDGYDAVETLDANVRQRGIAEVADDLSLASTWAAPASQTANSLAVLGLVVERERLALTLRDDGRDSPWGVVQQLHWRAVQMARPELAQRFEEYQTQPRACRLLLRTAGPMDDPALVRAARGPVQDKELSQIRAIHADARHRRVISVSWKSAVIWDLDRLLPLHTVGHDDYIHDVCLAEDGDSLWTVDSGGHLYLWDAHTGERQREALVHLPADTDCVFKLCDVAFLAGGRILLCAYDNRKAFEPDWKRGLEEGTAVIARWRLPEIRLDRTFEIDAHWLNAMAAGAEGTLAAVPGADDGTIQLWNVDSGQRLKVFTGYTSAYATQSASKIVLDTVHQSVSAAINQSVVSWDLTTGELLQQVDGHEWLVGDLRISADGRFLASTANGGVRILEPRRRRLVRTLRQAHASAVEFVGDSSLLLSGESDETLVLWDLDTPVLSTQITHHKEVRNLDTHQRVFFSPAKNGCCAGVPCPRRV
jgi:TIR domain/NB-ARC domain